MTRKKSVNRFNVPVVAGYHEMISALPVQCYAILTDFSSFS